jgi:bacteriocin biosynthesis cyclodehydratase domain-containing protein
VTQTVPAAATAPVSPAWERVAHTRPRVRRDVLCTDTGNGAVFHNAHGGFALTGRSAYRFATMLVPRLDGTATVAELCEGLPDGRRAMIAGLVSTLYDRGFARDVEPGSDGPGDLPAAVVTRFAAQLAYVDHHSGGAATRFARFRDARVAVLGTDEVARWAALSLVRNGAGAVALEVTDDGLAAEAAELTAAGCPVRLTEVAGPEAYDVVLVTPDAGPGRVLELLRAGLPATTTVLPAWTLGAKVVIGPSWAPGTAGCWACAALRLGSTGDAAAAARLWASVALPGPGTPAPIGGPLSAMIGNLLGYEVFRLRTGAPAAETQGRVLVQDVASLDVQRQPLLPDPRCPFCPPAAAEPVDRAAVLAWQPPVAPVEPAEDGERTLAELETRSVLVQPDTGPFRRFADEEVTQLPLKVGTVELGDRSVTAFDVLHVAGARLRALSAAAGAYVEQVVPLTGVLPAADGRAVPPARLGTGSGLDGPVTGWVPAESLLSGATVLVPTAAARPFGPWNAAGLVTRTAAGLGAAGSAPDAVVAGLLSALGHAALTRALRGQGAVLDVTVGDADPELTFLLRSADTLGARVELLELAAPVPVLFARTVGDAPRWALGTATQWRTAAVAALRDLLGQLQQPAASTGDPLLADLEPAALRVTGSTGTGTTTVPVAGLLDRLRDEGTDVLVIGSTPDDLRAGGLHVARVLLAAAGTEAGADDGE